MLSHQTTFKALSGILVFVALATGCRNNEHTTGTMPDEDRFKRVVLQEHLYNPQELEITEDGSVYFIQTNGLLMNVHPETNAIKQIGYIKNSDNGEFGLIGMALDPHFSTNHHIYLHYFLPDIKEKIAQVSRFTLVNDSLDLATEKKLVQIPYDNTCCHTAGSMSFDANGNLYFSTGDNTTAFETTYSPHDEREGHEIANDLRAAANTADLRGKICRIHPEEDGTYTIPEGNLFSDKKMGRPEIYIMGCRNAYRIYVDKPGNTLYWGEIGPDAGVDSSRGPRGYDEFNIATKAGNYGWPLFIGNNIAYPHIDFATGQLLDTPDPAKPTNKSRLNTGSQLLPPAQPATIYYPYAKSDKFPSMGEGGRAAIGGPVYHYNAQLKSSIQFPEYFDNAWFIGDWMRNWLKVVRLNDDKQLKKIEDLMPSEKFNKPIDMAFSPYDGALYMLEFGVAWGPNPEARLVRIEYNAGNRAPVAQLTTDRESGPQPLTVSLSAGSSFDRDKDPLSYSWSIDDKKTSDTSRDIKHTFSDAGIHHVEVTVTDPSGQKSSQRKDIQIGNSAPEISIELDNNTFFHDTLQYQVMVRDNEDGSLKNGIDAGNVKTTLSYQPATEGLTTSDGKLVNRGEILLNESDCKACHSLKEKSVGPDFYSVSKRYSAQSAKDNKLVPSLANKIIVGGTGVWGKAQMSAHPQLTIEQTTEIVKYILSLQAQAATAKQIPVSGNIALNNKATTEKKGFYVIEASYTDRGGKIIGSLSASTTRILRSSKMYPQDFTNLTDMKVETNGLTAIHGSHAVLRNIDLSGINQLKLHTTGSGGSFEVHLDSLRGQRIASFPQETNAKGPSELSCAIADIKGMHDIYLLYVNNALRFQQSLIQSISFNR